MCSVHPADDLLGDVGQLLLVAALGHGPDARHGGLLVLVSQQPGLLQTLTSCSSMNDVTLPLTSVLHDKTEIIPEVTIFLIKAMINSHSTLHFTST